MLFLPLGPCYALFAKSCPKIPQAFMDPALHSSHRYIAHLSDLLIRHVQVKPELQHFPVAWRKRGHGPAHLSIDERPLDLGVGVGAGIGMDATHPDLDRPSDCSHMLEAPRRAAGGRPRKVSSYGEHPRHHSAPNFKPRRILPYHEKRVLRDLLRQVIIQDDLPCERENGHAHSLDQKPKGFLVTRRYTQDKLAISHTRNGAALTPALSGI